MSRRTHHMTWRGVVLGDDVEMAFAVATGRAYEVIIGLDVDATITRIILDRNVDPGEGWGASVEFTWEDDR